MATKPKVTVVNKKRLLKKLNNLPFPAQERLKTVLDGGGTLLREEIKNSMGISPPDPAREYGDHTASFPGNAPRIDTADLVNAVDKKPGQDGSQSVGIFKESGQGEKAVWLELGTENMEPRPFAAPAFIKIKPIVLSNAIKSLDNYLKTL